MYQAPTFTILSSLTAELGSNASHCLTEFSSLQNSWDHSDYGYGVEDMDLPLFSFLTSPGYSSGDSDTCNMMDSTGNSDTLPQFTDLLATVTTHRRNSDQQVLQDKTQSQTPLCETDISDIKPPRFGRKERNAKGKGKRTNHSVHLWEFVRDLLLSPPKDQEAVRWENRTEGTFRVVKSDTFARLWGEQKKNKLMNYEKLSRALRHYYKSGILERVDGRLTYKFGKKAHGWREESPKHHT